MTTEKHLPRVWIEKSALKENNNHRPMHFSAANWPVDHVHAEYLPIAESDSMREADRAEGRLEVLESLVKQLKVDRLDYDSIFDWVISRATFEREKLTARAALGAKGTG